MSGFLGLKIADPRPRSNRSFNKDKSWVGRAGRNVDGLQLIGMMMVRWLVAMVAGPST
jgi:hypothetical protein